MLEPKRKAIGIFGGSFDPPHKGHVKISKISLNKIKLKKIYWVITKNNPFKKKPLFSLKERILKSKKILKTLENVEIMYLDSKIKSSRTINVIKYFRIVSVFLRCPPLSMNQSGS